RTARRYCSVRSAWCSLPLDEARETLRTIAGDTRGGGAAAGAGGDGACRAAHGADKIAAYSFGRRRQDEPAPRTGAPREVGPYRHHRGQWGDCGPAVERAAVRPGAHGRADARDGRIRSHTAHPSARTRNG